MRKGDRLKTVAVMRGRDCEVPGRKTALRVDLFHCWRHCMG